MKQVKSATFGQDVEGVAALHELVRAICGTQRRSVPHAPLIGLDWLTYQDMPVPEARPLITLDAQMQLSKYAPRIKVKAIELLHLTQKPGTARLRVTWTPAEDQTSRDEVTDV